MNTTLDSATLIALLWGIVSTVIFKIIPLKDGAMVLLTYLAPLAVVAIAVLIVDGTASFTWQKYLVDVVVAYGANQALFQAAKTVAPKTVL